MCVTEVTSKVFHLRLRNTPTFYGKSEIIVKDYYMHTQFCALNFWVNY